MYICNGSCAAWGNSRNAVMHCKCERQQQRQRKIDAQEKKNTHSASLLINDEPNTKLARGDCGQSGNSSVAQILCHLTVECVIARKYFTYLQIHLWVQIHISTYVYRTKWIFVIFFKIYFMIKKNFFVVFELLSTKTTKTHFK